MERPLLPQQDPNRNARRAALARAALDYRCDYTLLPPLALSASVPKADAPDAKWLVQIAVNSGRMDLVEERTDPAHHAALGASVKDGGIAGFRVALSGNVVMRGHTTDGSAITRRCSRSGPSPGDRVRLHGRIHGAKQ